MCCTLAFYGHPSQMWKYHHVAPLKSGQEYAFLPFFSVPLLPFQLSPVPCFESLITNDLNSQITVYVFRKLLSDSGMQF